MGTTQIDVDLVTDAAVLELSPGPGSVEIPAAGLRERALRSADSLPVLAGTLQQSIALFSRGEDVSVAELAAEIEGDVVITGTILGIANSAMYGGRKSVSSLRQAIARIGIAKARNVLLGLSVTRSFRTIKLPGGWSLARFNSHSLAAAALSDLIVRNALSQEPEWAFMAGLLHDVGLLVLACGLPSEFETIMAQRCGDVSLVDLERAKLGFTHFDLGAEMLGRWNCPGAVQQATLFGQRPGFEFTKPLPLGAVVKSATLLADAQAFSIFGAGLGGAAGAGQDQSFTTDLFAALEIAKPSQFLSEFRAEINELHLGLA